MERWHTSWLGLKQFPTELSAFDLDQFFTLDAADQQIVTSRRRSTHRTLPRCVRCMHADADSIVLNKRQAGAALEGALATPGRTISRGCRYSRLYTCSHGHSPNLSASICIQDSLDWRIANSSYHVAAHRR